VQEGVSSQFSGAAEIMQDHCLVEGVPGTGASFMVGMQRPYDLPPAVRDSIEGLGRALFERVAACRFEWAWENDREWLLQLNALKNEREPQTRDLRRIAPGYFTYDPEDGLEKLNRIARAALLQGRDVLICKPVGLTSHVCEILQEHRVRFFIKPS